MQLCACEDTIELCLGALIPMQEFAFTMKTPRLKLAQKGILIVVLPLLFQSVIYLTLKSQLQMTEQQAAVQELSKKIVAGITVATVETGELFGALVLFYNTRDEESLKALDKVTIEAQNRISNLANLIENEGRDPEEARKIRGMAHRFFVEVGKVRDSAKKEGPTSLVQEFAASVKFRAAGTAVSEELSHLAEQEEKRVINVNEQQKSFRESLDQLLDVAVFLNALLAVALGIFFVRGTVSNLSILKDNAWRLAAEQPLQKRIDSADEIGDVDRMFHNMARALKDAQEKEHQMIETLQASEERLASVINTVPVALVVADESGEIESLNPTAEVLFSYSSAQIIHKPITSLLNISGADSDPSTLLPRLKQDTQLKPMQMEGVSRDHEIIPVEVSVTSFGTSAGNRILATIIDVTERYKLERLKREFVAMVSHDIRAPLSSMRAIFELVNSGSLGEIPSAAQNKLNVADMNAENLLQMVTKLLDLEKLEAGLVELSLRNFAVADLIESALQMVSEPANTKSVELKCTATNIIGFGDKEALIQVLTNLLGNAIRYSPNGSAIDISAQEKDTLIEIRVSDHGPGIPQRKQAEIFERFKQANTMRDKNKGFGLGLAICKSIIAQHGETIGVDSEEGQGSTFWFTIAKAASDNQHRESSE
jgi:PAS domain S-box-containing protein